MFDHLFIAEKPSLAADVAAARAKQIGATARKANGYWEVGGDAVTWLFGHMFQQVSPEVYDKKFESWSIDLLPIIPERWRLYAPDDKKGRVNEINGLIKQAKNLVNVGDAGREGQLLVDELIVEAGKDPFAANVLRLWLQDMTQLKMIEALKGMQPNASKSDLYQAALGRQRADWLLGMNMTRLYTGLARRAGMQQGVVSVGRVQTPTLRIVVDRDREIAKFKAVDHYLPAGYFKHANGIFKASWIIPADHEGLDHEGRLVDKNVAGRIANKIAGKTGAIESYEVAKKSKAPPLPFDLSGLQKELSAKFGFTAQKTLDIAQRLYETHKVTSYPRTESPYLPTGVYNDEAAGIVANLGGVPNLKDVAANANLKLKSPAWNDSKITDHYAIIPTSEATPSRIASLPDEDRKVFDIIAKRFLSQFYPDFRWDSLSVVVGVEGERFKGTGRNVTDKGWKVVYETNGETLEKEDDEKEDEQSLPSMRRGDSVLAEKTGIDSKRTTPPSRFTDGTLIEAMKAIHKFVTDPEVKKKLKETSGIGTGATRASIIELLVKRNFLKRDKKYIVSTPLGQEVIDLLDQQLTDPGLTAAWEGKLDEVSEGKLRLDSFVGELADEVRRLVGELADARVKISSGVKTLPGHGDICPKCGKGHLVTRTALKGDMKGKSWLSCDAYDKNDPNSCTYAKWPDDKGKPIEKLEGDGKACPKCGNGHLATRVVGSGPHKGKRFLSCDNYKKDDPASCDYVEWEKPKVKPLPGHGDPCPTCGKGTLETRVVQKDGPNKGKSYLICTEFKRDVPGACQHFEFPKVEALPGDGKVCPKCGKGKMVTREVRDGANKGKRFLSCDNYQKGSTDSCSHSEWPDGPKAKIDPLPGDGDECPSCRKGKMVTRMVMKDGPSKGKRYLSCNNYKPGDPTSCNHAIWPKEDREVRGAGAPAGRGSKFQMGLRKGTTK